jgi:uncharacterized protein YggE
MSASKFACLLLTAITLSASAQTPQQPSLNITKDNRTITISATGDAEAEPEIADINIGFTSYGMTLPAAYKMGSETSNAIMKALLDAGATKSEIQSESQRVSRLSDYEMKAQKGMKFSVTQSWKVSVTPKEAAQVLDAAINAGANQSGDIVWRMKDNGALDLQAISKATERAHAMAMEMAKGMGVTLGKPIYATNSISSNAVRPRAMAFASLAKMADAPAPLAIESQRVSSSATVDIVYAIE